MVVRRQAAILIKQERRGIRKFLPPPLSFLFLFLLFVFLFPNTSEAVPPLLSLGQPVGGGSVTSLFGPRWGRMHYGIDIAVPVGTPIVSSLPGTVKRVSYDADGYGYYVVIDHGDGIETRYAHCDSISVKVGQSVAAGSVIAQSGNSGRSTGPHLHFELRANGVPINPLPYLGASAPLVVAPPNPILQRIYEKFDEKKDEWLEKMGALLWWSFVTLLTISFLRQAYRLALSGNASLGAMFLLIFKVMIYGGFFNWVFSNPVVVNQIPNTFIWLAEQTTGYSADVFGMIDVGLNIIEAMWDQSAAQLAWYELPGAAICIVVIQVLFFVIVAQMMVAKIEAILITLAGFVLLVPAGLMDSLSSYAKTYLRALIASGFKLFVLAVVCSLIQEMSGTLITYIEPGSSYGFLSGAGMILGVVCVLMTITCNVHTLVATTLYGGNFGGSLMDAITNGRIARLFGGIGNG